MDAPRAPWALSGESVVGLAAVGERGRPLPGGLHRMAGPGLVAAFRYADSPVGSYLELTVAEPARLGGRAGFCVTTSVVTSPEARTGGRLNWGFPTELGDLRWCERDGEVCVAWEERGLTLRARDRGPSVHVVLPVRALQQRADGPVVVPGRLRGRGRLARVEVDVAPGDPLGRLRGRHLGLHVRGLGLAVDPARLPSGLRATLRAPLRAPEPALSSPPGLGDHFGRLAQR